MLKMFPKYLNFENISKKCIHAPGSLEIKKQQQQQQQQQAAEICRDM